MEPLPSFWLGQLAPVVARPSLDRDLEVDVAIVGGGLTGLWCARYLHERDPSLSVVVLERSVCGFGASGRNGGWVSALFPVPLDRVAGAHGKAVAEGLAAALRETVAEVAREVAALGIDAELRQEGTLVVARNRAQWHRLVAEAHPPTTLLDAGGVARMLRVEGALGGLHEPACASVQPAKLTRGLADWLEEHGVLIYEETPVAPCAPHLLRAGAHEVRARHVVWATESFISETPVLHRRVLPLYSMMIVTEPLSDARYEAIGAPPVGLTFADDRQLVVYGQVTGDHRIAFGGRGAPYSFGSTIKPAVEHGAKMREQLRVTLVELLPALEGVRIDDFWGGTLGVTRDWYPRLELTEDGARIYGYAGDGVAMTNLMGRLCATALCAPLALPLYAAPFVRPPREWEPEPLRFSGVNLGLWLTSALDLLEEQDLPRGAVAAVRSRLIGL
jgi:glycine/D-amino acid oxidase-like deaminating enzyme